MISTIIEQRTIRTADEVEAFSDAIGGITLNIDMFDRIVATAVTEAQCIVQAVIYGFRDELQDFCNIDKLEVQLESTNTLAGVFALVEDLPSNIEFTIAISQSPIYGEYLKADLDDHSIEALRAAAKQMIRSLVDIEQDVVDRVIVSIEKQENCLFEGEALRDLQELIGVNWLSA